MAGWKDIREIAAWRYARDVKIRVDEFLERPNVRRKYGRSDQHFDAARSGPSNIAEGFGKFGNNEFARYARIAKGSEIEVLNHLIDLRDQRPRRTRHARRNATRKKKTPEPLERRKNDASGTLGTFGTSGTCFTTASPPPD
jgi:four helix bundle protein